MDIFKKIVNFFYKNKIDANTEQVIDNIQAGIATADGEVIDELSARKGNTSNVGFLNLNCFSLDDFVINDLIGIDDLKKLAELNGIQLVVKPGWFPLLIEMVKELDKAGWDRRVNCIKEKFAELRFYSQTANKAINNKYTGLSTITCETCGAKGQQRYNTGWDYVACRKHYTESRSVITANVKGFNLNGSPYRWGQIIDMFFDTPEKYTLTVKFKRKWFLFAGLKIETLYIVKDTIGFDPFLKTIPAGFRGLNYDYINQRDAHALFCAICGYLAVYNNYCECCENETWHDQIKYFEDKNEYIKVQQVYWHLDEGEAYERERNFYKKDPDYKIVFTDKDVETYLESEKRNNI